VLSHQLAEGIDQLAQLRSEGHRLQV
jgi:hypothetical protein